MGGSGELVGEGSGRMERRRNKSFGGTFYVELARTVNVAMPNAVRGERFKAWNRFNFRQLVET